MRVALDLAMHSTRAPAMQGAPAPPNLLSSLQSHTNAMQSVASAASQTVVDCVQT